MDEEVPENTKTEQPEEKPHDLTTETPVTELDQASPTEEKEIVSTPVREEQTDVPESTKTDELPIDKEAQSIESSEEQTTLEQVRNSLHSQTIVLLTKYELVTYESNSLISTVQNGYKWNH